MKAIWLFHNSATLCVAKIEIFLFGLLYIYSATIAIANALPRNSKYHQSLPPWCENYTIFNAFSACGIQLKIISILAKKLVLPAVAKNVFLCLVGNIYVPYFKLAHSCMNGRKLGWLLLCMSALHIQFLFKQKSKVFQVVNPVAVAVWTICLAVFMAATNMNFHILVLFPGVEFSKISANQ